MKFLGQALRVRKSALAGYKWPAGRLFDTQAARGRNSTVGGRGRIGNRSPLQKTSAFVGRRAGQIKGGARFLSPRQTLAQEDKALCHGRVVNECDHGRRPRVGCSGSSA